MIYNISIVGFGNNQQGTTFSSMATYQGTRTYCFKGIREYLLNKTKSFNKESPCFQNITFTIHIGRIKEDRHKVITVLEIEAIDVLKYRGFKK